VDSVQVAEPANKVTGWVARTGRFLVSVREEMARVTWPTRDELIKATRMIVIFSIILGLLIGVMDKLLQLVFVDLVSYLAR
jgi:preprotein translocase subunit SecE